MFIDISGIGNSGKSTVVDLLREVDGLFVPEYWFEFDLIRVRGGLLDLRHCLLEDWSPVRSHAAYHEFADVVKKMGSDPTPWNLLGLFQSTSQRYDRRFCGEFQKLSFEFLEQFKIASYRAEWPYDALRENSVVRFVRKVGRRLGFRKHLTHQVLLLDGKGFDAAVRAYLEQLYGLIVSENCDSIILNNGIEPFNPGPGLDMLGGRQIVVTRDPRDIYVSGLNYYKATGQNSNLVASDNDGMNKSFLATDDLTVFVERYLLYSQKVFSGVRHDVMHVPFEKLITNSDTYVKKIFDFLEIDPLRHTRVKQFFDPARSAQNVAVWKKYSRQDEIRYIESKLGDYLVNE